MKININEKVAVQLTQKGADWLNIFNVAKIEEHRKILEKFGTSEEAINRIFPTNNKRGDILQFSLWELMEKFGQYFSGNTDAPFINNSIKFLIPGY